MALKFINTNNTGATIKFVSSQDFPLGSPVYYKKIGTGNYNLSGNNGSKTISIGSISATGLTDGLRTIYFNFSNEEIQFNSYSSSISSNGTSISITGVNTSESGTGTVDFYDFELAKSDQSSSFAEYLINKIQSGSPKTYTAIKIGEINTTVFNWNSIKGYSENYNGLTPGMSYYLSPSNKGKIVNFKTDVKLFTAISRTKAFVNLVYSDTEISTNQSIIRDNFIGTGSDLIYTLTHVPDSIDSTTVFINGLFQIPGDAFTLTNNVITFTGYPPSGSKITIQYLKQYIFAGYDLYIDRKISNLSANQIVSLIDLFITQDSAQYRFFDINNPTISGIISLKNNGSNEPLVRVDTNSLDVSIIKDNSNTLNVYLLSNTVFFQNKTFSPISLRIYKET